MFYPDVLSCCSTLSSDGLSVDAATDSSSDSGGGGGPVVVTPPPPTPDPAVDTEFSVPRVVGGSFAHSPHPAVSDLSDNTTQVSYSAGTGSSVSGVLSVRSIHSYLELRWPYMTNDGDPDPSGSPVTFVVRNATAKAGLQIRAGGDPFGSTVLLGSPQHDSILTVDLVPQWVNVAGRFWYFALAIRVGAFAPHVFEFHSVTTKLPSGFDAVISVPQSIFQESLGDQPFPAGKVDSNTGAIIFEGPSGSSTASGNFGFRVPRLYSEAESLAPYGNGMFAFGGQLRVLRPAGGTFVPVQDVVAYSSNAAPTSDLMPLSVLDVDASDDAFTELAVSRYDTGGTGQFRGVFGYVLTV